jgi:hypothetical protein
MDKVVLLKRFIVLKSRRVCEKFKKMEALKLGDPMDKRHNLDHYLVRML